MIQRIQSLFLLFASLSFWAEFIFPFAKSNVSVKGFFADGFFSIQDHPVFIILSVLGGIITLFAIFKFRDRKLQLRLGYLSIVFAILLIIVASLLFVNYSSGLGANVMITDQPGAYLPLAAIVCVFLANRFISKDDKLVKSMDRLR